MLINSICCIIIETKCFPKYQFYFKLIKWLASSFGAGDDFSCENHVFSSPANSVSCPVTENPILLGQTFQLLERKLNL